MVCLLHYRFVPASQLISGHGRHTQVKVYLEVGFTESGSLVFPPQPGRPLPLSLPEMCQRQQRFGLTWLPCRLPLEVGFTGSGSLVFPPRPGCPLPLSLPAMCQRRQRFGLTWLPRRLPLSLRHTRLRLLLRCLPTFEPHHFHYWVH